MKIIIPYKPHKYQLDFHKDISRFRIIAGGRRVGKSKCCIQEVIKHSLETENALTWWVAPTYKEAKEIGWEELDKYLNILKPAIHSVHHSHLKLVLTNGSTIYFKGSDNEDGLRGRGLSMLVGDEAAFLKDGLWGRILRPALSDRKGKAILVSTPNGYNYFKELYEKNTVWSSYHWPTSLNPLITPEELASVQSEISQVDFDQEYMAQFITKAGRVYSDFNEDNILAPAAWDKSNLDLCDFYLSADFGFANATSIGFFAVSALQDKVVQFDEIYVNRKDIAEIITLLYQKMADYGLKHRDIKAIYTDPAGNAEELVSGTSPVDVMRMAPHNLPVINKASRISPGHALVRSWIKNVQGKRRFFITSNCKETIRSMYGLQFASGVNGTTSEEHLKDGKHDHATDHVRYFFVNKFDASKYVASIPSQDGYASVPSRGKTVQKCLKCKGKYITNKQEPPYVCDKCLE